MFSAPAITNSSFLSRSTLCFCYFNMKISFLRLLLILLAFSYFLSVTAVPGTRIQKLNREDSSALASLAQIDALNFGNSEEPQLERRIDLEIQDYGGTGANKDHDPKSPGRV